MEYNGNYQINNIGLYYVGHFNAMMYKVDFGCPNTCISCNFRLNSNFIKDLVKAARVDAEDGIWIHDSLIGKSVHIKFDEDGYIKTISDIFGNNEFKVNYEERAL